MDIEMNTENNVEKKIGIPVTLDDLGINIIKLINKNFKSRNFKNKVVHMSWVVNYSEKVSCSHSAPIGKPQNFMGTGDNPTHYSGWKGRLWIVYQKEPKGFGSDPLNGVHIHSGTGGYGNYGNPNYKVTSPIGHYPLSWDLKIFEDDWPAIKVHNSLIQTNFPEKHTFIYTLGECSEEV
jgi:hypothetical protein